MSRKLVVSTNQSQRAERFIYFGDGGVGKTSLLADMPEPLVLCAEDGSNRIAKLRDRRYVVDEKTGRTVFKTLDEFKEGLETVYECGGSYKTIGIDGIDAVDLLVQDQLLRANPRWKTIAGAGYGHGEAAVLGEWRPIVARLDDIRSKYNCHIVLVGHSKIRKFANPLGAEFDRYVIDVTSAKSGDVAGYLFNWADHVCFAQYEMMVREEGKRTVGTGIQGARLLRLHRTDSYDAKTRALGAPASIPLSWTELERVLRAGDVNEAELREQITDLIPKLPADKRAATTTWLAEKLTLNDLVLGLDRIKGAVLLTGS
jgi:hypothetical protein